MVGKAAVDCEVFGIGAAMTMVAMEMARRYVKEVKGPDEGQRAGGESGVAGRKDGPRHTNAGGA